MEGVGPVVSFWDRAVLRLGTPLKNGEKWYEKGALFPETEGAGFRDSAWLFGVR